MNKSRTYAISDLATNAYWGRGILIGHTGDRIAVAYFIMGRSEHSRNRIFYPDGTRLAIAPYDAEKLRDSSLIIYYPIKLCGRKLIVTNGDQTDTIERYLQEGQRFEDALRTRSFEPDAPHYTPRISGLVDLAAGTYTLSILKDSDGTGHGCSRYFYEYEAEPGIARFIHTYAGDATPLPSFAGEPERVAIPEDIDSLSEGIWGSLDADNKISLCTLLIDPGTGTHEMRIKNKRMGD